MSSETTSAIRGNLSGGKDETAACSNPGIRRPGAFTIVLGAATLLGAAIRLYRLDHFSYGLDEILQGYWIHATWDFLWKSIRYDAFHPPLDYMIGRVLEPLGPTDWARKLPDVLWGTATIPTLGVFVARRGGRAAGAAAAVLLAIAPFHVRYSQELRPYALGLFLLCAALLCLDRHLERPGLLRLALLYLACLGTAYALYFAALVLALAALGMLLEDARSPDLARQSAARRFLWTSPLFAGALFVAYLPWWPVVREAARRAPVVARPPLTLERLDRTLSFFFAADDAGQPLGPAGAFYLAAALLGTAVAWRHRGLRVLLWWAWGGLAAIELAGQIHPHFDFARRFLPAGIALPVLAAVGIASLRGRLRLAAAGLALALLLFDARALARYFDHGRADWRVLAARIRSLPPDEIVFTENQYSQLCTAFYSVGKSWLYEQLTPGVEKHGRPILNLDGEIQRLPYSWPPGSTAWLVLAGEPVRAPLRDWARQFRSEPFPPSEGAVLVRLDPSLREGALRGR